MAGGKVSGADIFFLKLSGLLMGRKKFFHKGAESMPLGDIIAKSKADGEVALTTGKHTINVHTPYGILKAGYFVMRRPRGGPTIIYHHGSGEYPCYGSFRRIVGPIKEVGAIGVCAPFHNRYGGLISAGASLSTYTAMVGSSTVVVEALVKRIKGEMSSKVVVSGLSLGGFVSVFHSAFFSGSDVYVPLLGGAYLGSALVDGYYRYLVSDPDKISSVVKGVLDVDMPLSVENIYPLFGLYDGIVMPEIQSRPFKDDHISYIPRGHIWGSVAYSFLRNHILSHM